MKTVLLALDFMVGIGDQAYALEATRQANLAIAHARKTSVPVIFTKVGFRSGHPEVASRNRIFGALLGTDKLVGNTSRLLNGFAPRPDEPVLDKKRFSAFAGSGLWTIVRASGARSVVLCGLSTSGVVLSTALELIDADFAVTILSNACADPDAEVHHVIAHKILASRATVSTVAAWMAMPDDSGETARPPAHDRGWLEH